MLKFKTGPVNRPPSFGPAGPYLKSEGRRSDRLHFSHSATFLTLPFSKSVFILTSPPQEQKNFWVALEVREFLLAWAIAVSLKIRYKGLKALVLSKYH
jgi:hypothetical protein